MPLITRKSSFVNARGILTTAYQVLHLLPYLRGVPTLRVLTLVGRYLPWLVGGDYLGQRYLPWGTSPSWPGWGYLPWPGGYLPWPGVPILGYPSVWTWLGYPMHLVLSGVPPPPGVNRQTHVKTVPYCRPTYTVGNNNHQTFIYLVRHTTLRSTKGDTSIQIIVSQVVVVQFYVVNVNP